MVMIFFDFWKKRVVEEKKSRINLVNFIEIFNLEKFNLKVQELQRGEMWNVLDIFFYCCRLKSNFQKLDGLLNLFSKCIFFEVGSNLKFKSIFYYVEMFLECFLM